MHVHAWLHMHMHVSLTHSLTYSHALLAVAAAQVMSEHPPTTCALGATHRPHRSIRALTVTVTLPPGPNPNRNPNPKVSTHRPHAPWERPTALVVADEPWEFAPRAKVRLCN